jgi:hypothetical protein
MMSHLPKLATSLRLPLWLPPCPPRWLLLWLFLCLASAPVVSSAWADGNQTKIDLQAALLNFLDMSADPKGRFRVIDRATGRVLHTHAGAMHPKIIPFGEDRVLCIEMFDSAGTRHDADFVMRRTPAGWMVVDVLFDQRPLLKKALAGAQ